MNCAPFAIYFNLINNYFAAGAPGHHGAKGRCIWFSSVKNVRFKFFEVVCLLKTLFLENCWLLHHCYCCRLSWWYWNAWTARKRRSNWTERTERVSIMLFKSLVFSFRIFLSHFVPNHLPMWRTQNARIAR